MHGEVRCSGAKNAVLPVLAASILAERPLVIGNVPHLKDITTMLELLSTLGARVSLRDNDKAEMELQLETNQLLSDKVPYDLVNAMRASVLVLGPLLARHGHAEVAMPGGCAIGARPIDLHLEALSAMGAEVEVINGVIRGKVDKHLKGANIELRVPTVTGTENILMAATLAQGETIISNAACEPEVVDLADCLITMGADIEGAGTSRISVRGVQGLNGCFHSVIPDRIEAATYLVAAAATRGCVKVSRSKPEHLRAVCDKLRAAGAELRTGDDWVELDTGGAQSQAVDVQTGHYPKFPTDMQAQFLALNAVSEGEATVTENIFENRFRHAQEMNRMGARIRVNGKSALCNPQSRQDGNSAGDRAATLTGATVEASDLRASASLVIAGLAAEGETVIKGIAHIDRGYERIEEKMQLLGADIRRIQ